jgi:hypothetical protein
MDNPSSALLSPMPDEPIHLSAPLAWDWSRRFCRHVNYSGISCADYHASWQYLRLLGIIRTASPAYRADFFQAALHDAIAHGLRRVAVSGAADYAMEAVVLWAFAQARTAADLTVLDICETPLRLNAWYAARMGCAARMIAGDILEHRADPPYGIIVAHAFLPAFTPAERTRLVAAWRDSLVPGGRVIATVSIRPDAPWDWRSPEAAEATRRRLRTAAVKMPGLKISADDIAACVDGFFAHRPIFHFKSREELAALFEDGGFTVAKIAFDCPNAAAATAEEASLVAIRN